MAEGIQNTTTYAPSAEAFGYWQPATTYSGLFGTLLSPFANMANSLINSHFADAYAKRQNQIQLDWWNMQNKYNSPKEQIKRLVEAGLSPNLAYGQLSSSNAGDVGTARVGSQEFNLSPTLFTDSIENAIKMASMAETLRSQRLENKKKAYELYFGYPTDFTLDGQNYSINDYGDWLRFTNSLKAGNWYQRNRNLGYSNEWNQRTMDDRVKFERFKRQLQDKRVLHQGLMNEFQTDVNSWYTANQIFNMVNSGINTGFKLLMPFLPGGKAGKIFKTFNTFNYY